MGVTIVTLPHCLDPLENFDQTQIRIFIIELHPLFGHVGLKFWYQQIGNILKIYTYPFQKLFWGGRAQTFEICKNFRSNHSLRRPSCWRLIPEARMVSFFLPPTVKTTITKRNYIVGQQRAWHRLKQKKNEVGGVIIAISTRKVSLFPWIFLKIDRIMNHHYVHDLD